MSGSRPVVITLIFKDSFVMEQDNPERLCANGQKAVITIPAGMEVLVLQTSDATRN